MKTVKILCFLLAIISWNVGCKKQLDTKPDIRLATISTLDDVQALLDYTPLMKPELAVDEGSADNYYMKQETLDAFEIPSFVNVYGWAKDYQFDPESNDWMAISRKIYCSNSALDGLENIPVNGDVEKRNNLRGQALFHRARNFYIMAGIWAKAYNEPTANTDLGIPMRLNPDVNEVSVRSSVRGTYEKIIQDLKECISLLPTIGISKERPCKWSAYAQLSRVYLSMQKYAESRLYSDSALLIKSELIDYNTLNSTMSFPFPKLNTEIIFDAFANNSLTYYTDAIVDSNLYQMYSNTDLRKTLFFTENGEGGYLFRGNYTGSASRFSGLATDEVYFNRAECRARLNDLSGALSDLNALIEKRTVIGSFVPISATTSGEALNIILSERRKELPFRFIRWMDIKRLNIEGANIILHRILNGELLTLEPNSPRYALAIPEAVISLSGIPQNPR